MENKHIELSISTGLSYRNQQLYYYLMREDTTNGAYAIASYSTKTDRLIITHASDYLPSSEALNLLIKIAKKQEEAKKNENQ